MKNISIVKSKYINKYFDNIPSAPKKPKSNQNMEILLKSLKVVQQTWENNDKNKIKN